MNRGWPKYNKSHLCVEFVPQFLRFHLDWRFHPPFHRKGDEIQFFFWKSQLMYSFNFPYIPSLFFWGVVVYKCSTQKTPIFWPVKYLGTSSASWYRNCDSQRLTSLQKLRLCLFGWLYLLFVCLFGRLVSLLGWRVGLFVGGLVGWWLGCSDVDILSSRCSFSNKIQVGVSRGISLKKRSPIVKLFFFGWYVSSILLLYHFISVELQTENSKEKWWKTPKKTKQQQPPLRPNRQNHESMSPGEFCGKTIGSKRFFGVLVSSPINGCIYIYIRIFIYIYIIPINAFINGWLEL